MINRQKAQQVSLSRESRKVEIAVDVSLCSCGGLWRVVVQLQVYSSSVRTSALPCMYTIANVEPDQSPVRARDRRATASLNWPKDLTDSLWHECSNNIASAGHRVSAFDACFHHVSDSSAPPSMHAEQHPGDPIGTEAPTMPPSVTCYRISRAALKQRRVHV
jgi:hypothetical protein